MDPMIRQITDIIYQELFDANSTELRKRLGIVDRDSVNDDKLRDKMGAEALTAISNVEGKLTVWMSKSTRLARQEVLYKARAMAKDERPKLEAACRSIDLVTSEPIPKG